MASDETEQQEQRLADTWREHPDTSRTHALLPVEPAGSSSLQEPASEDDPGSITLFRAPTFNVHAFTSRSHIEGLQNARGKSLLAKIGWASAQRQRLIAAETHPLPQVEILSQSQDIALPLWLEGIGVALFLGATLALQALSLFNYPAYTSDEGTYMANAWAVLQGRLTPYTFTYAHPPLGWIQVATWTELTGGITSFGNAINSGRVLMLVLATASSLLLYLIARRFSGSRSAGFLAMVLFTLSPMSLLYRHEVLLENIGTFWLLLSLCLITNGKSRLGNIVLAALALAIAILSKAVFLIFLPVMFAAVWLHATRFQRKFSLVAFLYIVLALTSLYPLFALLKGELLPAGMPVGGSTPHPDILRTLAQAFQAPGPQAPFRQSWASWVQIDVTLLAAGTIAMFINILEGIVSHCQLLAALFSATFSLFLLSSSVVYAFAIIPLLPFLALNIALALNNSLRWLTRSIHYDLARAMLLFALIGLLVSAGTQNAGALTAERQTAPQQAMAWWIREHVPRNAVVITNSYLYTDLHDPQGIDIKDQTPFRHAQIYSDAALDPAIASGQLRQDWRKIDFLVVDRSMLQTIQFDKRYFLLNQALHHAVLRTIFGSSANGTLIEVYQIVQN